MTPRVPSRSSQIAGLGRLLVLTALLIANVGCSVPTEVPAASPAALNSLTRSLVLGRLQVRGAEAVGAAWQDPHYGAAEARTDTMQGEPTLATLVVHNVDTDRKYSFLVDDESSRFEIMLPPGSYTVAFQYFKWLCETPATFDVPDAGRGYYIGTLRVDLFSRRSLRGWMARFFGGTIPKTDSDFVVLDEWETAADDFAVLAAGAMAPNRQLMRLGAAR
jgi:hypothetical protein